VLDEVLERVVVGLETNDFKYNQRRIAEVKYLGELYIYRMVDSALIFDTLYKILNYGHEGYAQPDKICPIDLPDDYFRIRLVCSLLETCGMYFEKGAAKKKLDFFLSFLQFYINVKEPMPMDIDFVVQDTYSLLRPQWKLIANDLGEASKAFSEACKLNYHDIASGKAVEPEEPEDLDGDGLGSDDARPLGDRLAAGDRDGVDGDKSGEDDNLDASDDIQQIADSDEDEHIVVTRPEEQRDPEADADFDRELAKLMAESVESRKFDRKPMFDVPLPMRRTNPQATTVIAEDSGADSRPQSPADGPGKMKFALLSKKGNRQQVRRFVEVWPDRHTDIVFRLVRLTFPPTRTSLLRCAHSNKWSVQSSNASRT
jgi:regulator of nonsense transcripts 2